MAASSTRGAIVMMICVLGVTAMGDPTPECRPVCEGDDCRARLTKFNDEECEEMLCRLQHPLKTSHNVKVRCTNEILKIRLPRGFEFRQDEKSYLVMRDRNHKLLCYNIKANHLIETPTSSSANNTPKKIHLQCSNKDQLLLQTVFVLNGKQRYHINMPKAPSCKIDTTTVSNESCNCWSPENVRVVPLDTKTLNVEWNPFYADKDLRVRVESVKENRKSEYKDQIVPNYQLCDRRLHNYTFGNFAPGTYVAMVGSEGCDCIMYRESEQIRMGDTVVPLPEPDTATPGPKNVDDPPHVYSTVVVAVIGTIAVVAIVAFGITFYIKKQPTPIYGPVNIELHEMDTGDTLRYTLVNEQTSDESIEVVNSLKVLLDQQDVQVELKDNIGPIRPRNELLVLVSLQDVHTFEHPTIDSSHWSNTITILKNYINLEESLVVYVPANIDHPRFRALQDDSRRQSRVVSLHQALTHINPACDGNSLEYKNLIHRTNDRLTNRKDGIKNILVISGFVHEHHNRACLELIKMLQKLGKNVAYAFNDKARKDIQTDGPAGWTLKQIEKADIVLVVVSKFLYKLFDCYTKEKEFPELNNLGICAPLTLKLMSVPFRSKRPEIVYVSFGYESAYMDSIVNLCPLLESSMRYNLVEVKQPAIYTDDDFVEHYALEAFLSRLSSDRRCVHDASTECGEFFQNVRAMAAMDNGWLSRRYGSMLSLASLFTASQLSLNLESV